MKLILTLIATLGLVSAFAASDAGNTAKPEALKPAVAVVAPASTVVTPVAPAASATVTKLPAKKVKAVKPVKSEKKADAPVSVTAPAAK